MIAALSQTHSDGLHLTLLDVNLLISFELRKRLINSTCDDLLHHYLTSFPKGFTLRMAAEEGKKEPYIQDRPIGLKTVKKEERKNSPWRKKESRLVPGGKMYSGTLHHREPHACLPIESYMPACQLKATCLLAN
jgi:hypothetical protein